MSFPITLGFGTQGTVGPITIGYGNLDPPSTVEGFRGTKFLTYERGIRFANVIRGKADFVVHGGPRVWYINSVQTVQSKTSDHLESSGMYSGAMKYRFRDYRKFKLPSSIGRNDGTAIDEFGNPVFSFTGK